MRRTVVALWMYVCTNVYGQFLWLVVTALYLEKCWFITYQRIFILESWIIILETCAEIWYVGLHIHIFTLVTSYGISLTKTAVHIGLFGCRSISQGFSPFIFPILQYFALFFLGKCRFMSDNSKIRSLFLRSGDNGSFGGSPNYQVTRTISHGMWPRPAAGNWMLLWMLLIAHAISELSWGRGESYVKHDGSSVLQP